MTRADANVDKARDLNTWKPLSELDSKIQADYDAAFYDGSPVSLQLAGKRLEEEKVLEMVDIVAAALKGSGGGVTAGPATYTSPVTADTVGQAPQAEKSRIQAWHRQGGFAVDGRKSGLK